MEDKSSFEEIKEKLVCKRENVWCQNNDHDIIKFSEDYKIALNNGKTEREFANFSKNYLLNRGFKEFNEPSQKGALTEKLFRLIKGKVLIAFSPGIEPIDNGINIVAAHIDSPRLDLKQNPLYEDSGFAYLDTHYYGGIKIYQ